MTAGPGLWPVNSRKAKAVSAIIAAQIIPCTLEFLDRTTIHCVEDYAKVGLPLDCEALLLMETDGHPAVVAEEAAQMERICREKGSIEVRVAKDDVEVAKLATARSSVAWISYCPVKGLAVQQLVECALTDAGIAGDRGFFLVDENDRLVNSKGLGALQQIVPRYDSEADSLTLAFPDGTAVSEAVAHLDLAHAEGKLAVEFGDGREVYRKK